MFERIIVCLFAFSLVSAALNASGIWDSPLPTQDINSTRDNTRAHIEEITRTSEDSSGVEIPVLSDLYNGLVFVYKALGVLKALVYSTFNLPELLDAYHIPSYISDMIMGMIVLLAVFMLLKWATGRSGT